MNASIALQAKTASRTSRRAIYLAHDWRSAIVRAARQQERAPPGAPLWHFLSRPAAIAITDDGELALELGDPPLVLLSSDAALLPELYLELEGLRYFSQLRRMNDRQRQHQARIYTAGAYLADALEQLADGLKCSMAAPTGVPADPRGHVSIKLPRATRSLLRAPIRPAPIHRAV